MKWMESFTLNTKDFNQAFCNLFQLGHSFLSPENEMLLRATSFDGFHSQASQVTFHKLLHHITLPSFITTSKMVLLSHCFTPKAGPWKQDWVCRHCQHLSFNQQMQVEGNSQPVALLGAWGRPLSDTSNSSAVTFRVLSLLRLCSQEEEPNLVATPMFDVLQWLRIKVLVFYLCLAKENEIFRILAQYRLCSSVLHKGSDGQNITHAWESTASLRTSRHSPWSSFISFPTSFPTNFAFPGILNYLSAIKPGPLKSKS